MKVIFVAPYSLRAWTSEPYFYAKHLKVSGYAVEVIAKRGGDGNLFSSQDIPVHEVAGGIGWYRAVAEVVRQVTPDIVHVFRHLGCGLLAEGFRKEKRPRFVVDIRSPLLHGRLLNALVAAKDRLEFLPYDAICSNTLDIPNGVRIGGKLVRYLPNGVDPDEIPPSCLHKRYDGPFRFVYVGSVDQRRKIGTWLEGFAGASRRLEICLDLYGKGTDADLRALKHLIRDSGVSSTVRLLQALPRRELFTVLSQEYDAAVAYLPKVPFDTGPPLKTLEYLACGLPVLATDTQGNRLYLKHGLNGLFVDETSSAVEQGISELLDLVNGVTDVGEVCRNSVAGVTWQDSLSRYLIPLYQELLA